MLRLPARGPESLAKAGKQSSDGPLELALNSAAFRR
jgi:hypothetical protein